MCNNDDPIYYLSDINDNIYNTISFLDEAMGNIVGRNNGFDLTINEQIF